MKFAFALTRTAT